MKPEVKSYRDVKKQHMYEPRQDRRNEKRDRLNRQIRRAVKEGRL